MSSTCAPLPSLPADLDRAFSALADPTRREIVRRLAAGGPASVSELATPFPLTLAAVSKHLGVLEAAGLLRREPRGRERVCTLQPEALASARAWIDACRPFWEARLEALDDLLAEGDPDVR